MAPLVKKRFGENLIALAACGSYARNEDCDYSDLELVAFVKKMPRGKKVGGFAKLYDGMLIELTWSTRETYLKNSSPIPRTSRPHASKLPSSAKKPSGSEVRSV